MLLIGLTGGIGSGKSSVSERLVERGAILVDADAIVKELQQPGTIVFDEMVERFGLGIVAEDGTLDRPAVAEVVFSDSDALADLGAIVHPRLHEEIVRRVEEQSDSDNVVVLDMPLLTESGWPGLIGTIVVDLDPEMAVERLIEHRGFDEADARARISNQASREERLATADHVVDNSGTVEDLDSEVEKAWEWINSLRFAGDAAAQSMPAVPEIHPSEALSLATEQLGEPVLVRPFEVISEFKPAGDQPKAIETLSEGVEGGERFQTLLGITGSGKSATIAWTIEQVQRPTLVIAPNKSLAAQLATEFREFFPNNRVEYFVSYYDYYQPEAYIASSDTYIEKDSSVNDEIDRLRHSATSALLTRRDVIVVASVSCIYGLGSPSEYAGRLLVLRPGDVVDQRAVLSRLVDLQYERNDMNLVRGKFRVRGDVLELHPAYEDTAVRVEFFGDEVEQISVVDPLTGEKVGDLDELVVFPNTHYATSDERIGAAIRRIETELQERLQYFEKEGKLLEAQRLRMRTEYDLEMLQEMGFCNGVENYSALIDGRGRGEPPYTLLDFFPADYLTIIDESHVTIPQLHGQYEGDRSRKENLVDFGFRLPSAADNRPLRFEEWAERAGQTIFLSATPGDWEVERSTTLVEQIVRPTGLVDPEVIIKPTKGQIDDLMTQINDRVTAGERVLVTTLTKKMAEDLTEYLLEMGIRVRYMHSEVDTLQRIELVRDLRLGEFDVLVGINLLREGLDIPEVSLVAILDADKEGFLRSRRSLIQMIGRAARNVNGQVVMYADKVTDSMTTAVSETNRRRGVQQAHNEEHGIHPQTIRKAITDILADLRGSDGTAPLPGGGRRKQRPGEKARAAQYADLPPQDLGALIQILEDEMAQASADLRFEEAARLRDEVKELKREFKSATG